VLEIGSGTGEATAQAAAADPARDVLAVEVHTPGVAALLRRVEERGLTNVRVLEGDGLQVLAGLPSAALDEVRVWFPDPWPKARHAKRRLVSPAFAALVADRLRPGGRLHVATDWAAYAAHTERVLTACPHLALVGRERGDRPLTRFEARGRAAGRPAHDLVAERTAGAPPRERAARAPRRAPRARSWGTGRSPAATAASSRAEQDGEVAGEGGGIAGHVGEPPGAHRGQCPGDRETGSGAGRVEHDEVGLPGRPQDRGVDGSRPDADLRLVGGVAGGVGAARASASTASTAPVGPTRSPSSAANSPTPA
jgi:tRNA (guanine-N7-)-methyltransferase